MEYSYWGNLKCKQDCGYFCRRHGMWITCDEVRSNTASARDEQLYGHCPPSHEHFEAVKQEFFEKQLIDQQQLTQAVSNENMMPSPRQIGGPELPSALDRLQSNFLGNLNIGDDEPPYYSGPQPPPLGLEWDRPQKIGDAGTYGSPPSLDYRLGSPKDTSSQEYGYDQGPIHQHKSTKSYSKSSDSSKKSHGASASQTKQSRSDKSSSKAHESSKSKKTSKKNRTEDDPNTSYYFPGQEGDQTPGFFDEGEQGDNLYGDHNFSNRSGLEDLPEDQWQQPSWEDKSPPNWQSSHHSRR